MWVVHQILALPVEEMSATEVLQVLVKGKSSLLDPQAAHLQLRGREVSPWNRRAAPRLHRDIGLQIPNDRKPAVTLRYCMLL